MGLNSTLSTGSAGLFARHPLWAWLLCALVALLVLCTLVGNAMVCLAVALVRKLHSQPANLLLVSLAVADFSVGLFVMPIALVNIVEDQWVLGREVCILWTSADMMLCSASILNLCAICIDRYFAVIKALTYAAKRTRTRITTYIAIVWFCALVVTSTPLIVLPLDEKYQPTCQVSQHQLYQIYATVITFYAPCFIMVTLYWKMWKAAKMLQQKDLMANKWSATAKTNGTTPHDVVLSNGKPRRMSLLKEGVPDSRKLNKPSSLLHAVRVPLINAHRPSHERTEDKARKTLGVIMSVFIVCWMPFFVLALLKSQYTLNVPKWLDLLVLWLGYSNSLLNPLIYCKYNREFRIPFREMLCCRFRTIQSVMRNESFQSKFGPPRLSELRSSTMTCAAPAVSATSAVVPEFEVNSNYVTAKLNDISLDLDTPVDHF